MDDHKINSTMETKKPESSEALKSNTNSEIMKNNINSEDDETSTSDCGVDVPTPLRFHRVHGRFVTISDDYCTAQRAISKEKFFLVTHEGLAFSSRPVAINEKVYLRLESVSLPYTHSFGFGFTDCDPNIIVDLLPRLCPYSACIFSNCLNTLLCNSATEGNTFFFFLKPSGEVCYGINDKEIGSLPKEINVKIPLWALIKLSRDISTVTLIDYPKEFITKDLKCTNVLNESSQCTKLITDSTRNNKTEILKFPKPTPSRGVSPEKPTFNRSDGTLAKTTPYENLSFHSVHGKYIKLSPDKTVASCEIPAMEPLRSYVTHECYVFSSRPIQINEKVHLKLKAVSEKLPNAFSFGFTACDPCIIPNIMNRLCRYSPCILGNSLTGLPSQFCMKDMNMHFYVTKTGQVHFMVNEKEKGVFNGVNVSSPVWAVIKVTSIISSVRLVNKKQDSLESNFSRKVSSILETSSGVKEEEIETSSQNTKNVGDDEKKNIPADNNILTEKLRTNVTSNTKGQFLLDWWAKISEKNKLELKKRDSKVALTVQEAFKFNIQHRTSNTSAKPIQPTSSSDVKYTQNPGDCVAIHFAKIVEYHLNRVSEDKRLKCMQKIVETLDNSFK